MVDGVDRWAVMNHSSQEPASRGQQPGWPQEAGQPQYRPPADGRSGPYGQAPAPAPGPQSASAPAPDSSPVIEIRGKRLRRYDRVTAGEWTETIRQAGPGAKGEPLAYVHVPQDAPKGGRTARPPFSVTGVHGEPLCSVRSSGGGVYEVHGGDGALIGRITRGGGRWLPWPRRVHWTVQSAQGGEPLTGKVGSGKGWTAMVLLSPLYFAYWAVMAAQGLVLLLIGDKEEARKDAAWELEPPSWTRWRAAGEPDVVMEHASGAYRFGSSRLDHRLAYAQAVLHAWDRA